MTDFLRAGNLCKHNRQVHMKISSIFAHLTFISCIPAISQKITVLTNKTFLFLFPKLLSQAYSVAVIQSHHKYFETLRFSFFTIYYYTCMQTKQPHFLVHELC